MTKLRKGLKKMMVMKGFGYWNVKIQAKYYVGCP
jgi:hypothetical protein